MSEKSAALLLEQQEPQMGGESASTQPMPIVTKLPPDVKVLRDFVKRRHIPLMDMLEVVQTIYPRCDKSLLSKCIHGEETGARLRDDALKVLVLHFREDSRQASPERRRAKPNRCVCRVTDAIFKALQRRLQQTGQSVQDYIEALLLADLQAHREELKQWESSWR